MIRLTKIAVLLLFGVIAVLGMPSQSSAQVAVGVSIHIGPPALPVYTQPVCPAAGYIWTPGYWAYGPYGYYWVPGTWVLAPTPGFLWTPGYWGFVGGAYLWHGGYWGPHVGFYGGINYGYGYGGVGFVGGEWRGGAFHYNTAVTNVNATVIHNTYVNNTVVNRTVVNNVSYNGGTGGTLARPNASEEAAMREHHIEATSLQAHHEEMARNDHSMLASENHGHPGVAATARPGVFHGEGVVAAHSANMSANRSESNANSHMDRPPSARNNNYNATKEHGNNPNKPSEDRPQSVNHSQTNHSNTNEQNPNHANQAHTNTQHENNNHPNNSKPPKQNQNRPPEHEQHQGGGHEASGHGR
jgi:WXXGXW repeat (2 copies)